MDRTELRSPLLASVTESTIVAFGDRAFDIGALKEPAREITERELKSDTANPEGPEAKGLVGYGHAWASRQVFE